MKRKTKIEVFKIGQYTGEDTFHIMRLTEARLFDLDYALTYQVIEEGILTEKEAKARLKKYQTAWEMGQ